MHRIMLQAILTSQTGRPGCIGFEVLSQPEQPIAGFAAIVEVDPNGLFADPDECDRLAAEIARRWNCHHDLLAALKEQVTGCFDPTCLMCTRHEEIIAKAEVSHE